MSDATEPTHTESSMVADKGALSVPVNESYTLTSFVITGVDVSPGVSANVYIVITASNGREFARTVPLVGDAYTAWAEDAYLYTYVQNNIADIFTP